MINCAERGTTLRHPVYPTVEPPTCETIFSTRPVRTSEIERCISMQLSRVFIMGSSVVGSAPGEVDERSEHEAA
jgi:hypothetical protein